MWLAFCWLFSSSGVVAQTQECVEFTLSNKQPLSLPAPYLIKLHSSSPCVLIADALLGADSRRYLIAYNQDWQAIDTIQTGADSAARHFLALNESQAIVISDDITYGTLTYTFCDFNRELPYRRVTTQTSLVIPGLKFDQPPKASDPPKRFIRSQTIECVGLTAEGILLVIRGPFPTTPPKPNTLEVRTLLFLKIDNNGILSPNRYFTTAIAYRNAWQPPKRTLPRLPLFDPATPQPADNALAMVNGKIATYYIQGIGYVETNLVTSLTKKQALPKGYYDPYMLKVSIGNHVRILEYRQRKTMLEGLEGGYGRKSIYSLVGVYDQSDGSVKPEKLNMTDEILTTRPQLFWRGKWYGINKRGKRVEI